jgi:hypothetical protein
MRSPSSVNVGSARASGTARIDSRRIMHCYRCILERAGPCRRFLFQRTNQQRVTCEVVSGTRTCDSKKECKGL